MTKNNTYFIVILLFIPINTTFRFNNLNSYLILAIETHIHRVYSHLSLSLS